MPARRSIALYSFIFFCSRADVDHSVLNPVDKYYYVESGGVPMRRPSGGFSLFQAAGKSGIE
jgi:hypothetical protein